ncbi:MAG: NADH-quinone oxidoreductase subunit [Solirubrobacterales bacterium]|nr:NADH-quinone oxidoreductase subunit [Solirubrobacterales bacterium]
MPDQTGLELLAQSVGDAVPGSVLGTVHFRGQATLLTTAEPIREVLQVLKGQGYRDLMGVMGVDYYPEEPRFGVLYELLDRTALDRVRVKVRVPLDAAVVPSVTPDWPTANHQEREVYDMFGVVFPGHPDPRRILMPEDYEGFPQRRDFPIGGEPVLFTKDDERGDYTRQGEFA